MKIKLKKVKSRNYLAVHAHFRNSKGVMRNKKKEEDKNFCRQNDLDTQDDMMYDESDTGDE